MYTISQILAAAGVMSQPFESGGVTVALTTNHQLIGTHAVLTRFRQANLDAYEGWDSHHIFEDQDVRRMGLGPFSPLYDQMVCVLIPKGAHQGINRDLRKWNPPRDLPTVADLELAYSEAYRGNLDNYCGAPSANALRQELMKIMGAVLKNLIDAADQAQLDKIRNELQKIANKISSERSWHQMALRDVTPGVVKVAAFAASVLGPLGPIAAGAALINPANSSVFGAGVSLLNKRKKPPLSIWDRPQAHLQAAQQAVTQSDPRTAALEMGLAEVYFHRAEIRFRHWREGQELGARHAELLIAAAAITAMLVATGLFVAEAAGTAATAGAAGGGAAEAGSAGPRVARFVRIVVDDVESVIKAESLLEEAAAEERFAEPIKKALSIGTGPRP